MVVDPAGPPVGDGGTIGSTGGRGALAGDVTVMEGIPIASGLTGLTRIAPSTGVGGTGMPTPIKPSKPVAIEAGAIVAVRAQLVGGVATMAVVSTTAVAPTATVITGTAEADGDGTIIPSVRSSPADCSRCSIGVTGQTAWVRTWSLRSSPGVGPSRGVRWKWAVPPVSSVA